LRRSAKRHRPHCDRPAGTTGSITRILLGAFAIFAIGMFYFYARAPGPTTNPTATTSDDRKSDRDMTLKQPGN
jgi:hypothetical protein